MASEETKYLDPEHLQAMRRRQDEYSQPFREALIRGEHRDEFSFADIRLATAWLLGVLNSIYRWYQPDQGRLSPTRSASRPRSWCWAAFSTAIDEYTGRSVSLVDIPREVHSCTVLPTLAHRSTKATLSALSRTVTSPAS